VSMSIRGLPGSPGSWPSLQASLPSAGNNAHGAGRVEDGPRNGLGRGLRDVKGADHVGVNRPCQHGADPHSLSGMKQRLGIAAAMLDDPPGLHGQPPR
jgi:hypothetical protein